MRCITMNQNKPYGNLLRGGLLVPALVFACLGGCGDNGTGTPDARPSGMTPDGGGVDGGGDTVRCPSSDARTLVQEIVHESLVEVRHVTLVSTATNRGYALTLPGIDERFTGILSVESECTEESTSDPRCAVADLPEGDPVPPFLVEHDKCVRVGCEGAGIATVTTYMTDREAADPEEAHAFSYETTVPLGTGVYNRNPRINWRIDMSMAGKVEASTELLEDVYVTPRGGSAIDISHTGTLKGLKVNDELTEVAVNLRFPALTPQQTMVSVSLDSEANATGTIRAGDTEIGTLSGAFVDTTPLEISWTGCDGDDD